MVFSHVGSTNYMMGLINFHSKTSSTPDVRRINDIEISEISPKQKDIVLPEWSRDKVGLQAHKEKTSLNLVV